MYLSDKVVLLLLFQKLKLTKKKLLDFKNYFYRWEENFKSEECRGQIFFFRAISIAIRVQFIKRVVSLYCTIFYFIKSSLRGPKSENKEALISVVCQR